MKKRILVYGCFCFFLVSFISPAGDCGKKCPRNNACTSEFRTLTVNIPVEGFIDNYQTVRAEDGKVINYHPAPLLPECTYPLLSDGEMDLTNKAGKEFYFVGFSYGQEVLREKFVIGNDGSHVVMVKGDTNIKMREGC